MKLPLHRWLVTLFAIAMLLGTATSASAGPTLDRIIAEKQIRLGVRVDAPPFASVEDGRLTGFSVELCGLIAGAVMETSDLTTMTGHFVEVSAEDRFDKLAAGEIDVLCGATTATLSRRETMSFSIPTFVTGVAGLVSEKASDVLKEVVVAGGPAAFSGAAVQAALEGRTVAVRAGTTAEEWLRSSPIAAIEGTTVATASDHRAGARGVAAGTIDIYFADKAILVGLRSRLDAPESVLVSDRTFTNEPYALALPRGDEDLRLMIDRALSHIYRTGAVYTIYERYFGKPNAEVALFYTLVTLPE
jgi:ABC-type amino acid transport substrate-binding protein